ncbi:MAG: DUF3823 domain-containing protein [Tannerella sp.]|nr:DUF3823 domain-containing protein [Tannerella sp.]
MGDSVRKSGYCRCGDESGLSAKGQSRPVGIQRGRCRFPQRARDRPRRTDEISAPEKGTYYVRIAARTANALGRYNYSKTVEIQIP